MVYINKNDTVICVEWFTQCNLTCNFCYNFLNTNINKNKKSNFEIVKMLNKINYKNKIFLEAGGELLIAPYFNELMEYRQKHIANYKGLVFSNGEIEPTKFKNIITRMVSNKVNANIVISPHIEQKLQYVDTNLKTISDIYNQVNINLVLVDDPKLYLQYLVKLTNMNLKNVYINLSFDYKQFAAFDDDYIFSRYKVIKFIKSYKICYDYIKEHFKFLNYKPYDIEDKYQEILDIFKKFENGELELTEYNPTASFIIKDTRVEVHIENEVEDVKVEELDNIIKDFKIDNSNVSDSELLTFNICYF